MWARWNTDLGVGSLEDVFGVERPLRPDVPARLLFGLVALPPYGMRGAPSRTGQPRHLATSWLGLPGSTQVRVA